MAHFSWRILGCLAALGLNWASPSPPFWGPAKYCAFDNVQAVAQSENAATVLGPVRKDPRPLLFAEKPWETSPNARMDNGYPNIVYDPDRSHGRPPFRLWYDVCLQVSNPSLCSSGADLKGLVYAESEDGITWQKPDLGTVNFPVVSEP